MCYVKPGPRCSSHALKALDEARATGDPDKLLKAQRDYALTPAGIKEVAEVNPAAADILEENRQTLIASVKAQKVKHEEEDERVSQVYSEGFNADTAEPHEFDGEQDRIDEAISSKEHDLQRFYKGMIYNKYLSTDDRYNYDITDEEKDKRAFEAFKADTSEEGLKLKQEYNEKLKDLKAHQKASNELDIKYRERGGWNRAFLAVSGGGNGHVHSSMRCGTCNKGKTPTRFEWKTSYSGKDEDSIVADAGYRACTVCYPSAPVGNKNNLPTKMFSKDEMEKVKARVERERKAKEKAAAAISKAPTRSGEPLKINGNIYKTETTAVSFYTEQLVDAQIDRANASVGIEPWRNPESAIRDRDESFQILKSLAEKRDVSIKEVQEELKPKVMTKLRKYNKDRNKPSHLDIINNIDTSDRPERPEATYFEDDFGLSEEKYNTSPLKWND